MEYIIGRRRRRPYRERVYRRRISFLRMTEQDCRNTLHLSREVVQQICHIVATDHRHDPGPCALPVAVKVTAALAFLAAGSFQHTVASVSGLSQAAVGAAVHAVSSSLVRHANEQILFPMSPESQLRIKQDFLLKYGFPGVLGAIDCTHVQLRAPDSKAVTYVNRKGVHSINIQVICDANCLVTHVYANFPGSAHDSFILDNSVIPSVFEGDAPMDGWLLGDNGYQLKPWLMTPYITATTKRQRAFNHIFGRARSVIERTFGLLKMRFRCLDRSGGTLQYSPKSVSAFFVACCVLHNIAIRHGCHFDLSEETLQDLRQREAELHVPCHHGELQGGQEGRDRLAASLAHE
ncbi:biogenesis of lysosome-related organelles complex 1 subunit 1 isoform X2 [Phyllopteryx taeniolatus]|nr:biogenesis of lysosome-related organelles complex 1 subunit 1 isoform X2 [Phyllopteryx taeniolatus]